MYTKSNKEILIRNITNKQYMYLKKLIYSKDGLDGFFSIIDKYREDDTDEILVSDYIYEPFLDCEDLDFYSMLDCIGDLAPESLFIATEVLYDSKESYIFYKSINDYSGYEDFEINQKLTSLNFKNAKECINWLKGYSIITSESDSEIYKAFNENESKLKSDNSKDDNNLGKYIIENNNLKLILNEADEGKEITRLFIIAKNNEQFIRLKNYIKDNLSDVYEILNFEENLNSMYIVVKSLHIENYELDRLIYEFEEKIILLKDSFIIGKFSKEEIMEEDLSVLIYTGEEEYTAGTDAFIVYESGICIDALDEFEAERESNIDINITDIKDFINKYFINPPEKNQIMEELKNF